MSSVFSSRSGEQIFAYDTTVPAGAASLQARLSTPTTPDGYVIIGYSHQRRRFLMPDNPFAHAGLATMHLHLHTPNEFPVRFSADSAIQLTQRLISAIRWLQAELDAEPLPIGLFGAYQDAGVALSAAAFLGDEIGAVVSWQGRPDHAMNHLSSIKSPTLLLVHEDDESIVAANAQARWWMHCTHQVSLVPGQLRLLQESSTLPIVNQLTGDWYRRHLLGRHPLKALPRQLLAPANSYAWDRQLLQ